MKKAIFKILLRMIIFILLFVTGIYAVAHPELLEMPPFQIEQVGAGSGGNPATPVLE